MIVDESGTYSVSDLDRVAEGVGTWLRGRPGWVPGARVAFKIPPSFEYLAVLHGVWRAGGVAVPLPVMFPELELDYLCEDAGAVVRLDALPAGAQTSAPADGTYGERALLLYTSGTTSKPKGVVWTHAMIRAQVETLHRAWGWTEDDSILLVLPLHHVHGLVNVVMCALAANARLEILAAFDADRVWERLSSGELTLFMAVPTIYHRLIQAHRDPMRCDGLRLMVSGSAALPVPVLEKWRELSGHTLLERYGMTEIGMALSNPLNGERRPGSVGTPLPGVELKLVDGEIRVKGPSVFTEYWNNPSATAAAFDEDGWFKTGDMAVLEDGAYRILGRSSVDIIKTGGEKVSALEIEAVLLTHPDIVECAIVGIPDEDWGERVCVAVVCDHELSLGELRAWAKERLAPFKVPTKMIRLDHLPKNPLGKVVKPDVSRLFV